MGGVSESLLDPMWLIRVGHMYSSDEQDERRRRRIQ